MKKVLLLLGDYAEDYETMVPYQILKFAGYEADCIAPGKMPGDKIKTAVHDFLGEDTYCETQGHRFLINADFNQIRFHEYAGLYITGGRAPEYLRANQRVLDMVRYFFQLEKPVAAICHGIQILASADVLKGRTLTAYPSVALEISLCGGTYVAAEPQEAVVDRNLVTSPAWPGIAELMKYFVCLMEKNQGIQTGR